jgi:hypothetical protein
MSRRRIVHLLRLEWELLIRNREHLFGAAFAVLVLTSVAGFYGPPAPRGPVPAIDREPVPVATIRGGDDLPELAAALSEHGFRVVPMTPGMTRFRDLFLSVAKAPDGPGRTVDVDNAEGVEPEARTALRQALAEARDAYRSRLMREAGVDAAIAEPMEVDGISERGAHEDVSDLRAGPVPSAAPASLDEPDVSAPLAIAIGFLATTFSVLEGFVLSRHAGRLEILFSTRVTPWEYVAARTCVALLSALAVATLSAASLFAFEWSFGLPHDLRYPGIVLAGPLAALVLTPLALVGASLSRRLAPSSAFAYAAMAPVTAPTALLVVAAYLGFDPSWQAYLPVQGAAQWLQGRPVDPSAAMLSAGTTLAVASAALAVARRRIRATHYAFADI